MGCRRPVLLIRRGTTAGDKSHLQLFRLGSRLCPEIAMRLLSWSLVVSALLLLSCGGPPVPKQEDLYLSITPASATIATGTNVALHGDAAGFTRTPTVSWYMLEGTGNHDALYCGLDSSIPAPSASECPGGYVTYNSKAVGVPSEATYYAPSVPGTYHVVFLAFQSDGYFMEVLKTSTAEITVTE